jgi:hypothetical protein
VWKSEISTREEVSTITGSSTVEQSATEENAKESPGFVRTLTVRLGENEHSPHCYLVSSSSGFGRRPYSATTRSHRRRVSMAGGLSDIKLQISQSFNDHTDAEKMNNVPNIYLVLESFFFMRILPIACLQ